MLTKIQEQIIRDICSIQFSSLERILVQCNLDLVIENLSLEDYLESEGFTRADFDHELISVYRKFKEIEQDPQRVFFILNHIERRVFRLILFIYENRWEKNIDDLRGIWDMDYKTQSLHLSLNQFN